MESHVFRRRKWPCHPRVYGTPEWLASWEPERYCIAVFGLRSGCTLIAGLRYHIESAAEGFAVHSQPGWRHAMRINVTWSDIRAGRAAKTMECMVALALKRELGVDYASVGYQSATIRAGWPIREGLSCRKRCRKRSGHGTGLSSCCHSALNFRLWASSRRRTGSIVPWDCNWDSRPRNGRKRSLILARLPRAGSSTAKANLRAGDCALFSSAP